MATLSGHWGMVIQLVESNIIYARWNHSWRTPQLPVGSLGFMKIPDSPSDSPIVADSLSIPLLSLVFLTTDQPLSRYTATLEIERTMGTKRDGFALCCMGEVEVADGAGGGTGGGGG